MSHQQYLSHRLRGDQASRAKADALVSSNSASEAAAVSSGTFSTMLLPSITSSPLFSRVTKRKNLEFLLEVVAAAVAAAAVGAHAQTHTRRLGQLPVTATAKVRSD